MNFVCLRRNAIIGLLDMISSDSWPAHALVLFQAPPGTGKTAAVNLLVFHCRDYHIVRFIFLFYLLSFFLVFSYFKNRINLALFNSSLKKCKIDSTLNSNIADTLIDYINDNMVS